MSRRPLKSTDKRRAGFSDNISASSKASRLNGAGKTRSNEFHAGHNGQSKRSK